MCYRTIQNKFISFKEYLRKHHKTIYFIIKSTLSAILFGFIVADVVATLGGIFYGATMIRPIIESITSNNIHISTEVWIAILICLSGVVAFLTLVINSAITATSDKVKGKDISERITVLDRVKDALNKIERLENRTDIIYIKEGLMEYFYAKRKLQKYIKNLDKRLQKMPEKERRYFRKWIKEFEQRRD